MSEGKYFEDLKTYIMYNKVTSGYAKFTTKPSNTKYKQTSIDVNVKNVL